MEKTCDIIKDLLPLYIDGVCSEDSKRAVEEHLKTCESCREELEGYKGEITAADGQEKEVIKRISSRWKRTKTRALLTGILVMAVLVIIGVSALFYSAAARAVTAGEVKVEDLSLLPNSHVYFALRVSDGINAKGADWFEWKNDIYITLKTERTQLFERKKAVENFAGNTDNYSRWEFDTKMGGVKNIYLYEGLKGYEDGKSKKTLIWSSEEKLPAAKTEAETWIRTYHPWGNTEPGLLANTLFEHKNPYVGNMSANGRLLTDLKVGRVLGNFKNELQTKKEPYGYTLLFEETVKAEAQEDFNSTMKKYALCMLALIENLSEVSWKYTLAEDGKESTVTQNITREEASKLLGSDIKGYGASAAEVQNLLYTIGIEQ